MNQDVVITSLVVLFAILAFAREWYPPALVATAAMVVLLVTGVITSEAALAGFSNPAPVTVAALFIIARAVERTGALRPLLERAMRRERSERSNLLRLLSPVALASSVFNNTPIVAMLIAPVSGFADRQGRSPSRFLMPISFATLLGGTVTLIGTSTNLVVSGLMVNSGLAPLAMFEMTPVALPIAVAGVVLLACSAPTLLPARKGLRERFNDEFREFTIEMEVVADGPMHGVSVSNAGLRHLQGVFLAWIRRGDEVISPVSPEQTLHAGDRLGFVGGVDRVMDLQNMRGLRMAAHKHVRGLDGGEHRFVEVVIASLSPLVGRTIKSVSFREQYSATVLAVHRSGERIAGKLGELTLDAGDTLLLLADRNFSSRWRDRRDFLLVSEIDGALPVSTTKSLVVLGLTAAMIAAAALNLVPILHGSLVAALALVASHIITAREARNAIDLDVLLLIASSFGIGAAIEQSGLAAVVADAIVSVSLPLGPIAVLASIVLATMLITELITNNAAVVLIFPIATATAIKIGVDPRAYAIAIAIAASTSFLTPIGYQTNAMVYGPGGYRFGDYVRLGFPLTMLVFAGIVGFTALYWGML